MIRTVTQVQAQTPTQSQFIPMRDVVSTLPPTFMPCSIDLNISVRRELVDIARLLFSNDRGHAVRRAKGLFIDDTHVEFFMRYVYEYRKHITVVTFSQNYMGISIVPPREIPRSYIIGVNDYRDGTFINGADLSLLHSKNGINDCYNRRCRRIVIATASDDDFREVFGYDKDVLEQETVLTTGGKDKVAYRIQGEVVFELTRVDDEYFTALFRGQVIRNISVYMADKVMRLLIDHGFNPDAVVDVGDVFITIPGALTGVITNAPEDESLRGAYRWVITGNMSELFASILGEYFTVRYVGPGNMYISDGTVAARVNVDVDGRLRDITLRVTAWWDVTDDSPTKRLYDKMMSELIGDVKDMLHNSERVDELMIGNHYIKIERGLPVNFEYEPDSMLRPKILENLLITVSGIRTFLVSPRTVVTIEHPQHGTKRLRFNDVYDLRIRTTMVSDRHIEGMNAVALKRIINNRK